MKKILKFGILAVLAVSALCSCTDENTAEEVVYLPVTANNISGTWQLAEQAGAPLAEGAYVYLDIVRRDTEFTVYEKVGTFATDIDTGIYSIDEETGVISGRYDHSYTDWNHSYVISELTADRMVWTATDDATDVSVYVRVDSIPEDIKGTDTPDTGEDTEDGDTAE